MPALARSRAGARVALSIALVTAFAVAKPRPAAATVFSNASTITLADVSPAVPYPSTIAVTGVTGTVTDVNVTLTNIAHSFPDDIDLLLVGPSGANAIVLSDAGGNTPTDLSPVTVTLDDQASLALNTNVIVPGTFQPANFAGAAATEPDTFPAPAPAPLGGSALSVFNGTGPNGTWSLYALDDEAGDMGEITNGWSLDITGGGGGGTPSLSVSDVAANEGNSGTTDFTFTVTLSSPSTSTVTASFQTVDGSATVADTDYQSKSGTVSFAPSETSQLVKVLGNGDTKFEPTEAFTLHLSTPTNATIADADGTGTITNDDSQPSISVGDVTHNEGNASTTNYDFAVTLSNPSSQTVSATYQTVDGSATVADNDYQTKAGTVTFTSPATTQTVTVLVNGDTTVEPTEAFTLHLSAPTNGTIGDADGTGTITNDDSVTPACDITGTPGDDVLKGTAGPDHICGLGGNDSLYGQGGADTLEGGEGNDVLLPGAGDDPSVDGGPGSDFVSYTNVTGASGVSVTLGAAAPQVTGVAGMDTIAGIENIVGSPQGDVITGDDTKNTIDGRAGGDELHGGAGADVLIGGAGADTLDGGPGTDVAKYYTSPAGVTVNLSTGSASSDGAGSADTLSFIENVVGSNAAGTGDTLTGSSGANQLYGFGGDDTLTGLGGNDLLDGGAGTDTCDGGTGTNTIQNCEP